MSSKVIIEEQNDIKLKKPRKYKVIMHNDDYTSMDFVIKVLVELFNKQIPEATQIMYNVHLEGSGVAGIYSYDIACTKIAQAEDIAKSEGFPFKLTMEEE